FADLRYNAPENVKPVVATTEQYLQNILGRSAKGEEARPDLVVVDPPRTGLGQEVARTLASLGTAQITYVSCDPATLARDLRVLLESGYNLEQVHLVDLFPQTFHIE